MKEEKATRMCTDWTKADTEEYRIKKTLLLSEIAVIGEPSTGFFNRHHPEYIALRAMSWDRDKTRYKNFFKRFVDDIYKDEFREYVFKLIGVPFYPTD